MAVTTREGFKQYCLRSLGAPVLEINVDDDQLEDRIDEALMFWNTYHHEGVIRIYLKQLLSRSTITVADASSFSVGDTVTGDTSGTTCIVVSIAGLVLTVKTMSDAETAYAVGEALNSGATTVTAITVGEFDNKYVSLPDYIYGVARVLPFVDSSVSRNMFDVQYQVRLNDMHNITSSSIIYYKQVMSHMALLDHLVNADPTFEYNRIQDRLYLNIDWDSGDDVQPGDYVVAECYRAVDPATSTGVWNEHWIKSFCTALFKKQWATNLKKFSGLQLPGGVSLDGTALYQEAHEEIDKLKEELLMKSAPLGFFMG